MTIPSRNNPPSASANAREGWTLNIPAYEGGTLAAIRYDAVFFQAEPDFSYILVSGNLLGESFDGYNSLLNGFSR